MKPGETFYNSEISERIDRNTMTHPPQFTALKQKGLVALVEQEKSTEHGKGKERNKMTKAGIDVRRHILENPEAVLTPLQEAKKYIEEKKMWFRRWIIATVWKVFQEKVKELGTEKKVGDMPLCLATYVSKAMEEEDSTAYEQISSRIVSNINRLIELGIFKGEKYDPVKHSDVLLGTNTRNIQRTNVLGISNRMRKLARSVAAGECGPLRGKIEKDDGRSDETEMSIEQKADKLLARSAATLKRVSDIADGKAAVPGEILPRRAIEIFKFLKVDSKSYPRKKLIGKFGTEEEVYASIDQLEEAGCVERSRLSGIVTITGELPT